MTKWRYTTVLVLGLLVASVPAMAQDSDDEDDNTDYLACEMLSTGIGAAVYAAGTASGAHAWTVGMSAAFALGIKYSADGLCNHVTEETVEAYENAMIGLGIQIMWHTYHDPYMQWCLSVREYDCLPYIEPSDIPDPSQQAFVEQSWEAVRYAVEQLVEGGAGNSAHITPHALGNALQAGFERSGLYGGPTPFQNSFTGGD